MFDYLISVEYFADHKNIFLSIDSSAYFGRSRWILLQMKTSWFCFGSPYHLGIVNMNCHILFYKDKLALQSHLLACPSFNTHRPLVVD